MANFVFDSFTGNTLNDVTTHTGEAGATWTRHATYPSGASSLENNELQGATFNDSIYYASGMPATAEYDVTAPLHYITSGTEPAGGVVGRVDTASGTMYGAEHYDGAWYLFKLVAGTRTTLGSYTQAMTVGSTYVMKLEIRDGAKKLFIDGVERISSADNSITAAGKAGIKLYKGTAITALSDFTATDVVVAATATTLSGPSSGTVGVASTNFTAGADGAITGTVIVTPSDGGGGGTFTPTTVSISAGTPTGTFTYTPASTGAKTISTTNNGGLSNPTSLTYTSNAAGGSIPAPFFFQMMIGASDV